MLNEEDSVCADIRESFNLNYCREYLTLDAVFYAQKHEKYFDPKETYVEYIEIALEHANSDKTSYAKINKLAVFSSPLKVLITYPSPAAEKKLLVEYYDILEKANIFLYFTSLQKHLVIFGFPNKIFKRMDWRFYLYSIKGFKEIE